MFLDSKQGGLGVPDLTRYATAALLDQLPILWSSSQNHRWAQLENDTLADVTCKDWLIAIYLGLPPPKQVTLLSLSHTFTLWKSQVVQKNWIFIPRPDIPFRVFKCWTLDYNWPSWDTFGIHTLGSLYSDETFHTFESIAVKFDIPRSYFFQYLQIRNMVNTISWPNNPPHPLPFQRFLTQSEGRKGDISLI